MAPPHQARLSVSDIERLAKAGVAITFASIANQIYPDTPQEDRSRWARYPLVEAFWERWERNMNANANANHADEYLHGRLQSKPSFGMYAIQEGDKIIALIHNGREHITIEDPSNLYPSDSLMANVHLWLEASKK